MDGPKMSFNSFLVMSKIILFTAMQCDILKETNQ